MTKNEALKLALDALEAWETGCGTTEYLALVEKAVTAIKEVLAQPEQEPWGACVFGRVFVGALPEHVRKLSEDESLPIQWLYTTPPKREWVGLTDEERRHVWRNLENGGGPKDFADAIEAKLKEKNT